MNAWVAAHDRWYARATPAERAAFDASRACPKAKVFTPKMFPTPLAWALFLTRQRATEEVIAGTPLPVRHEVKGQVRVYDALQDRDAAIAGVGRCAMHFCSDEAGVARRRITYANGVVTERFMCDDCARIFARDPMNDVTAMEAVS